jgi:multifunctional methyltransferase subunit TRM112
MRLLTHNTLKCPAKDVVDGYPLQLEISGMEIIETTPNFDFLKNIIPTLEWSAILLVASAVGIDGFPEAFDQEMLNDDTFLLAVHNLLIDVHIINGVLICPESGRRFPIVDGIPSMKLPEAEV